MRLIGKIDSERDARRLGRYLAGDGIANQIEQGREADWLIWVEEEEHVEQGLRIYKDFVHNPHAEEFRSGGGRAKRGQKEESPRPGRSRRREVDLRTEMHKEQSRVHAPVTIGLVVISVGLTLLSNFGDNTPIFNWFSISNQYWNNNLPEVMQGQVWRLVTPIFMHLSILHIVFNMSWMTFFGPMIERRMGHGYFLTLVIVFAVVSNLAQYWMKDPAFGGMSGVVYGLFGYVWIHDKYEFGTRYQLPPNVIAISLTWYVVCLLGLIGSVANWAHSGGLFAGMLWGFVVSGHWRRVLRRIKGQ